MAKAPIPGQVKTRLAPLLGPTAAAELYRCFLDDTLATVGQISDAATCVICPNEDHRRALERIVPPDAAVIAQPRPGLMAGLAWSFSALIASGARKVLLIDADSPTLPADLLGDALEQLDGVDVSIGPCPDGGYYLVGARRDCPGLFDGVAASTSGTFQQTIDRARALGLSTNLLPAWLDVDTADDFHALLTHLADTKGGAPKTRSWLTRKGWIA